MVLDPGASKETGDRLTEKIVGKSECVKCVPEHCQEEVEGHLGVAVWAGKGLFPLLWLYDVAHFLTPYSPCNELS